MSNRMKQLINLFGDDATHELSIYNKNTGAIMSAPPEMLSTLKDAQWQPIETAPRDNPRCLVFCPDHPQEVSICPAGLISTKSDATHWMPLPQPPSEG